MGSNSIKLLRVKSYLTFKVSDLACITGVKQLGLRLLSRKFLNIFVKLENSILEVAICPC
jgi:hypothetical protein